MKPPTSALNADTAHERGLSRSTSVADHPTESTAGEQPRRAAIVSNASQTDQLEVSRQTCSQDMSCVRLQVIPARSVSEHQLAKLEKRLSHRSTVSHHQRNTLQVKGTRLSFRCNVLDRPCQPWPT